MTEAYRNHDPFSQPVEQEELLDVIRNAQADALVDDWRIGVIQEYLVRNQKDKVCLIELWMKALNPGDQNARRNYHGGEQGRELGDIMVNQLGWIRGGPTYFGSEYGYQKAFLRPEI